MGYMLASFGLSHLSQKTGADSQLPRVLGPQFLICEVRWQRLRVLTRVEGAHPWAGRGDARGTVTAAESCDLGSWDHRVTGGCSGLRDPGPGKP